VTAGPERRSPSSVAAGERSRAGDGGSPTVRRPLSLAVLTRSLSYPVGMASATRARLVAHALAEQGDRVLVVCTRAGDPPEMAADNDRLRGWDGRVAFEHTSGRTTKASGFRERRLSEARGAAAALCRLGRLRAAGRLDAVYYWWGHYHWRPAPWLYVRYLRALGVPIVEEVNELPWTLRGDVNGVDRRFSPLGGMSGALCISRLLLDWARRERGPGFPALEVPILVDVREQRPGPYPTAGPPRLMLAASMGYRTAVEYVFAAMEHVWRRVPDCRLAMTVADPVEPLARELLARRDAGGLDPRIELHEAVPRRVLLDLYGASRALLAPLFEDDTSRARFPTKLGEYLASGRPVVTSAVGEVPRYFVDGETAFVAPPGLPEAFADRICRALEDAERAARVGAAGRALAEREFDYRAWGPALHRFFASVAGGAAAGSGADSGAGAASARGGDGAAAGLS